MEEERDTSYFFYGKEVQLLSATDFLSIKQYSEIDLKSKLISRIYNLLDSWSEETSLFLVRRPRLGNYKKILDYLVSRGIAKNYSFKGKRFNDAPWFYQLRLSTGINSNDSKIAGFGRNPLHVLENGIKNFLEEYIVSKNKIETFSVGVGKNRQLAFESGLSSYTTHVALNAFFDGKTQPNAVALDSIKNAMFQKVLWGSTYYRFSINCFYLKNTLRLPCFLTAIIDNSGVYPSVAFNANCVLNVALAPYLSFIGAWRNYYQLRLQGKPSSSEAIARAQQIKKLTQSQSSATSIGSLECVSAPPDLNNENALLQELPVNFLEEIQDPVLKDLGYSAVRFF